MNTTAGSAAQIVLTQIVPRERLVEAHAKNALASSTAEVTGPGAAGALIKLTGAPLALLADARAAAGLGIDSARRGGQGNAERGQRRFLARHARGFALSCAATACCITMASCVGVWQICNQAAMVVQILFATRQLGLTERGVGLSYVALGVGTVAASAFGYRVVRRLGPGPTLVARICDMRRRLAAAAVAPLNRIGVAAYAIMLLTYGMGAVFIFINFSVAAPIRHAGTDVGPHDQHDALVDPAAGRSRCAVGRLAGRSLRASHQPSDLPGPPHCCSPSVAAV